MMSNPYKYALQKYMLDVLGNRYMDHNQVIDRITHYLVTEQDIQDFSKMITAVFEIGYLKAVNDYRKEIEKNGYKVNIIPEKKND